MAEARAKAAATGQPATVDSLTTENSTITAQPGGQLVYQASVLPTRVHRGSSWVAVDTKLQPVAGGGYAPAASPSSVVFSGGGSQPLATLSTAAGASLALKWPTALPTPTVSGSTLTYPSVLPAVDLQVTATQVGGFSETLVVKTAAAAANPALATLKLGTVTHGLTVSGDSHGNLEAASPDGQVLFHAPAPAMWDSTTTSTVTAAHRAAAIADPTPATASNAAAPGNHAHVAAVGDAVSGSTITLIPNQALLKGSGATFPEYIDPTWTPLKATGDKQHFDEIQQGCPDANNLDSTTYGYPGVGNNSYSGCIGKERALYMVGIPSKVWGATLDPRSASFNIQEKYSASCSATDNVNLDWVDAISNTTTWNTRGPASYLTTASAGPACTSQPTISYDITSTVATAAYHHWTYLALGLFSADESDSTYFKRFDTNPNITITYDHAPNQPSSLTSWAGGTTLGCDTASPYPLLGKTDATTPVTVSAHVSDPDSDSTQTTFQYWVDGSTTKHSIYSVNGVASGGTASAQIPSSFVQGLADGTTVDWQVTSLTDGHLATAVPTSTVPCHFTAYPATPTLSLQVKSVGTENTPSSVTVASTNANDPAVKFVYQLDSAPPTTNAPANETLSGSQVSNGSATITVVPTGPGMHNLNVIGYDAANNASVMDTIQLAVTPAPAITYSDFAHALNNTAVSSNTNTAAADADGSNETVSLQDLQAAGWNPGGQVTVDGATFTLPQFAAGTHDNVLADRQTINLPAQTQGQSLVMLAFGTYAEFQASTNTAGDFTAPHVPVGTNIVGSDCSMSNNLSLGKYLDCTPASGTVNYADTTVGSNGSEPYYLSAPDWVHGSGSLAALSMPHRNLPNNGQETKQVNIYAFAIHLEPGKTVTSITLPDVSGPREPGTTPATDPTNIPGNTNGSPIAGVPGLHILGIAVRNATTDAAGNTWTGAWSSPAENHYAYSGNTPYQNLTIRTAIVPSVTGNNVRIHLSNQLGTTPLTLTHVTVATQTSAGTSNTPASPTGPAIATPVLSPVPTQTPVNATFGSGNTTSVTIPAGGDLYSNPIASGVTAGTPVLVSFAVTSATLDGHNWATGANSWITATGSGDHTADTTASAFQGTGTINGDFTNVITGLDTVTTGNLGTVAFLGDGLYTGTGTTPEHTSAGPRLSDAVAADLAAQTTVAKYGVIDEGIEGNRLSTDASGNGGRAALTRLDRDLLSEPGLQTVVLNEGMTDLLAGQSEDTITTNYLLLRDLLKAWHIKVVFTTLTPCSGYSLCTTTVEAVRADPSAGLNTEMLRNWPDVAGVGQPVNAVTEDLDSAVSANQSVSPETLGTTDPNGTFDAGDHVNLTPYGTAWTADPLVFNLADLSPFQ